MHFYINGILYRLCFKSHFILYTCISRCVLTLLILTKRENFIVKQTLRQFISYYLMFQQNMIGNMHSLFNFNSTVGGIKSCLPWHRSRVPVGLVTFVEIWHNVPGSFINFYIFVVHQFIIQHAFTFESLKPYILFKIQLNFMSH